VPERPGTEFFCTEDGHKVDARLHEHILANKEAERALADERTLRLLRGGFTLEQIARLYGDAQCSDGTTVTPAVAM